MNAEPAVLIIDDDAPIRRMLRLSLETAGYRVYEAASGRDGLTLAAALNPDIVLLDLGLPDMDGLETLKRLRVWSRTPVVVVSVRNEDEDKVALLDAGADDYLVKPFSTVELLARLRAAQRHSPSAPESATFHSGPLTVDLVNQTVTVNGAVVRLSVTEYALLRMLVQHAGRILTLRQILGEVWGPQDEDKVQYLRVYVASLRRKLEKDAGNPQLLITEPGVGYRLNVLD
jgi:two-component system, OmpR family, KDP operon response regulator KdpE